MDKTLQVIKRYLQGDKKFAFMRFGDGEIKMMNGYVGKAPNQFSNPQIRQEIIDTFQIQDPNFLIASASGIHREEDDNLKYSDNPHKGVCVYVQELSRELVIIHQQYSKREIYYNAMVFPYYFVYHFSILKDLIDKYIHPKKTLYIGGPHLNKKRLIDFFNVDKFIEIPHTQAYNTIDEFYPHILKNSRHYDLVLLSAGISKIGIAKRLWEDTECQIVDIGSISEPIVGICNNRQWMVAMKNNSKTQDDFFEQLQVLSVEETLSTVKDKINSNKKFAFTRFNDGDLLMIDDWEGKIANQWNSPELRKEIIEAFEIDHEDFMISTSAKIPNKEDDILTENKRYVGLFVRELNDNRLRQIVMKHSERLVYYNPTVFQYFAVYHPDIFCDFLTNYIQPRKTLYVGGKKLNTPKLNTFFNIDKFIEIPDSQAYPYIDEMYPSLLKEVENYDLVLLSAGFSKNALQKRLWFDSGCSTVDMGSLSNAIVGDYNRSWHAPSKDHILKLCTMLE